MSPRSTRALREGGFVKDALRLRRTQLEALDGLEARPALLALAEEAEEAGLRRPGASSGAPMPASFPSVSPPWPRSPPRPRRTTWRRSAVWRATATARKADVAAVLAHLEKALAGHPGADAALALAETLAARVADSEADLGQRRLDLLRAAHAAEYAPARRARLGRRLAETLEARGDALGAVAVLESALAEATSGPGWRPVRAGGARRRGPRVSMTGSACAPSGSGCCARSGVAASCRRRWRRTPARLQGEARLAVLAEHATLLEGAGEAEKALDVRLMALAEFPGAPTVLDDARRRLEATGRAAESLALAIAALDHTTDLPRRRQLLRDVASLTENAAGVDRDRGPPRRGWRCWRSIRPTLRPRPPPSDSWWRPATGSAAPICSPGRRRAPRRCRRSRRRAARPAGPRCSGGWRSCAARGSGRSTRRLRLYVELGAASKSTLPPLARSAGAGGVRAARAGAGGGDGARGGGADGGRSRRARCSIARAPSRSAAGATTPSATRWRRSTSIRATWRRSARWRSSSRSRARARLLADELGRRAAKLEPLGRGAALLRPGPGRGARGRQRRPRARPTGARCRSIRRWPSQSRRSARWPRRRGTGRRSPSCSRARSG